MVNTCGVVNCRGNYDDASKIQMVRLPVDEVEQQRWKDAIPQRVGFEIKRKTFWICLAHWPKDTPMKCVFASIVQTISYHSSCGFTSILQTIRDNSS